MRPIIAGKLQSMVNRVSNPMDRIALEIEGFAPGQTTSGLRDQANQRREALDLVGEAVRNSAPESEIKALRGDPRLKTPQYDIATKLLAEANMLEDVGGLSNRLENRMSSGLIPTPPPLEGNQFSPIIMGDEASKYAQNELPVNFSVEPPWGTEDLHDRIEEIQMFGDSKDGMKIPALERTIKMGGDDAHFFTYETNPGLKGLDRAREIAGGMAYPYYRTRDGKDIYDMTGNTGDMIQTGVGSAILNRMQGGRGNAIKAGAARAYLANKNPGEWFNPGDIVHPGQYLTHPKVKGQIEAIAQQVVPIPDGILKNSSFNDRSRPVSIVRPRVPLQKGMNTSATSSPNVNITNNDAARWEAMADSYDRNYDPMNQQYM